MIRHWYISRSDFLFSRQITWRTLETVDSIYLPPVWTRILPWHNDLSAIGAVSCWVEGADQSLRDLRQTLAYIIHGAVIRERIDRATYRHASDIEANGI